MSRRDYPQFLANICGIVNFSLLAESHRFGRLPRPSLTALTYDRLRCLRAFSQLLPRRAARLRLQPSQVSRLLLRLDRPLVRPARGRNHYSAENFGPASGHDEPPTVSGPTVRRHDVPEESSDVLPDRPTLPCIDPANSPYPSARHHKCERDESARRSSPADG